jgi:hypothetical protein
MMGIPVGTVESRMALVSPSLLIQVLQIIPVKTPGASV